MSGLERTIQVNFPLRVFFTRGVFASGNPLLRDLLVPANEEKSKRLLVVIDEALAQGRPQLTAEIENYFASAFRPLELVAAPLIIEGGERTKNSYHHVGEIHSLIDRHHIDRHSYLLAIGGGALLDMAGLAAATAHRGVRHVRLPSTTLSQADSGVGVKNGINSFGKKNFIGTFTPPFAVVNDYDFLETLLPRDKRAGYIEAIKVALIRDAEFFTALERDADALARFDPPEMERLIYRCAELHLNHIASSGDPFEFGSARPLDFGHWAAHKLEQLSEYKIRHGEAVAIGLALDVIYSREMGFLNADVTERILQLMEKLGFDLFANELLHTNSEHARLILNGLEEFREHLGGELCITLLKNIGEGFEVNQMSLPKIVSAIQELQQRSARREKIRPAFG